MPSKLNLFPARVPIGSVQPDGSVLMSPEFARALVNLMVRVGGPTSLDMGEIVALIGTEPSAAAMAASLSKDVAQLAQQVLGNPDTSARVAALERRIEDLARLLNSSNPVPVDWEHPGKIGAAKSNTGKFTAATVQTLNKLTFTQPANSATYTLADGKTFTVTNSIALAGSDGKTFTLSNTLGLSGTDGAFLNIGNGGTLGTAAYAAASSFAGRTGTALAPVATDAASTQTLANSLRAALISVGIGT